MNTVRNLGGINVALYSCFTADDAVDEDAVRRLTQYYVECGVRGVYVCGSSGEGFLMSTDERKRTLEAVMSVARDRIAVIAHVGAAATRDACELARHAETCGADAVSAVPCVYYRLSEKAIENNWATIIGASRLPFIIYNIPQLTGYSMSRSLFDRMLRYPEVIGIKNSSESIYDNLRFKEWGGDAFLVFHGMDEQYAAGRMMGADGGIGGTYGVMPELFLRVETLIENRDIAGAIELQRRINAVIQEMLTFPSLYGAAKEILRYRGIPVGKPRLPFLPVADADLPRLDALAERLTSVIDGL